MNIISKIKQNFVLLFQNIAGIVVYISQPIFSKSCGINSATPAQIFCRLLNN